jgi:hypothetical protein
MLAFERDETKDYNKKPCCKCKYVQECQKITSTLLQTRGLAPNAEEPSKNVSEFICTPLEKTSVVQNALEPTTKTSVFRIHERQKRAEDLKK